MLSCYEESSVEQVFRLKKVSDCVFCGAKRLQYESKHFCCSNGEVVLPSNAMPEPLKYLFIGDDEIAKHFQTYVRTYNNTFAFTSLGIHNYDKELCNNQYKGIYTFKVQGQIYHFLNELDPGSSAPRNLQLYFYDTDIQVEKRVSGTNRLDREVVSLLVGVMEHNPYAAFFRSIRDHVSATEFSVVLRSDPCLDQRVYNVPTTSQVAAVWLENSENPIEGCRNIQVYAHSGRSLRVQYYYGCYDPLQYPLLFPLGDVGWHEGIQRKNRNMMLRSENVVGDCALRVEQINSADDIIRYEEAAYTAGKTQRNVSCREYYAYKLQIRDGDESMLLHSGRLLQQFVVDVYVKIESQRLDFFRKKQQTSRSESFQGLVDSVGMGFVYGDDVGKKIILPASFIGGPRDMRRRYMDAMSLVQRFGKPDLFLTMTCNPNWLEIKELLEHNDKAQNRPDIIARVFNAKLHELKNDIIKKEFFGRVAAYTYVIEFQKRGLPHAHILLILCPDSQIGSPDLCDQFIQAEIPDQTVNPRLYALVKKHMIHGPCGSMNPECPCMIQKKGMTDFQCKFEYPKTYCSETTFDDTGSYPTYRRRANGATVKISGHVLDSRWVVPYNAKLLLKYDCHINVELCATIKSVKYIYKYVYKGHDRVSIALKEGTEDETIDEITEYQNARWVSPPEAVWRIYGFPIAEMRPAVYQLQVHLQNFHYINFYGNTRIASIVSLNCFSKTMLTEFFRLNAVDEEVKQMNLLYIQFPEFFVWHNDERQWRRRKQLEVIARLVTVNPVEGERYYLRLLLLNIRAPTSFESLKKVDGFQCETFRAAAEKLGLLSGDFVVTSCLDEAVLFHMPTSLRKLFATLLVFCDVGSPRDLWSSYKTNLCEDILKTGLYEVAEAEKMILKNIGDILESMGKHLRDYSLDYFELDTSLSDDTLPRELYAEYSLAPNEHDLLAIPKLNREQRYAFDVIMSHVNSNIGAAFFVDGPGGTGKTFLYRCLLAAVRSKKWIALATATSGIAASILPGGRTAHSRFKLPIDGESRFVCNIGKQSADARLLKEARLLLWDEASMANRRIIESLDTTLRDIMQCDSLFGGKVIVFGGDFRQTLPVIRGAKKEDIIQASLVKSSLIWPHIIRLRLVQNMRANEDPRFAEFLMRVGNGTEQRIFGENIHIPSPFLIKKTSDHSLLQQLLKFVYPDLCLFLSNPYEIMDRAVLTPKNEIVSELNSLVLDNFPGESHSYISHDVALETKYIHCGDFLNSLSPPGLPPHMLVLKRHCPVLLLRNLNPCEGLCNGTRLVCDTFGDHVISCYIAVGEYKGKHVLIPRIPLQTSIDDCSPIPFKRTQFPLKLCFAMTINKAQGQTLDVVGIYLREPVFSHGQLYVALSRARNSHSVRVLICNEGNEEVCNSYTANVVYKEIIQCIQ